MKRTRWYPQKCGFGYHYIEWFTFPHFCGNGISEHTDLAQTRNSPVYIQC
jgi:hypothetical protein